MKKLTLEEDAFGQMLWAYYKGKEVFEIWERDDGYISCMHFNLSPLQRYHNFAIKSE